MTDPKQPEKATDEPQAQAEPLADTPLNFDQTFRSLGPAAILAIAWAVLPAIGGFVLLARSGPVGEWLNSFGPVTGTAIYATIFVIAAGFGLLPTYAQAFIGGWAFGLVGGTTAALAGFVGASVIGRVLAQSISKGRVEETLQKHRKAAAVRDELLGAGPLKTLGLVFLIRLPPNSPFAVTNLALGTTGVPWVSYVIGTAAGMLPRTALVVSLGAQVSDALSKDAFKKPGPVLVGGIVVSVVVLMVLIWIGQKALDRVTQPRTDADSTAPSEAGS
ncbi:MAG: VTT domain-containing protein [Planctomycetota bacterium]